MLETFHALGATRGPSCITCVGFKQTRWHLQGYQYKHVEEILKCAEVFACYPVTAWTKNGINWLLGSKSMWWNRFMIYVKSFDLNPFADALPKNVQVVSWEPRRWKVRVAHNLTFETDSFDSTDDSYLKHLWRLSMPCDLIAKPSLESEGTIYLQHVFIHVRTGNWNLSSIANIQMFRKSNDFIPNSIFSYCTKSFW